MAGPRSPTTFVTAQLVLRHSTIFFSWCYADFQQRSNERLVVLPQTRSSSYHGAESTFRPDGVKLFKNIQILGWVVLPQTRPSFLHGVKELFRLDILQPLRKHLSWWLGRVSQHLVSRLCVFGAVKLCFRLMWCRLSTAFKWTAGRAPPNTVQFYSQCWNPFSSKCYAGISKTFKLMAGQRSPTSPVTAQLISRR